MPLFFLRNYINRTIGSEATYLPSSIETLKSNGMVLRIALTIKTASSLAISE